VANCCIHSLQLQLKNAVVTAPGAGSLDKVNAMQLLHSVCRLQESLDMKEWRHTLIKSSQCAAAWDPQAEATASPVTASNREKNAATCKAAFETQFAVLCSWHDLLNKDEVDLEAKITGTPLAEMQAPVLTRWWTVGEHARHTFTCHFANEKKKKTKCLFCFMLDKALQPGRLFRRSHTDKSR